MKQPFQFADFRHIPIIGMIFVLMACATTQIDWNSRVGHYSYDQAVLELGPPDKLATLSEGTRVAEWLTQRGFVHGSVDTFYGPYFRGPYVHHYSHYPSPDEFLRLTFGPEGTLSSWRRVLR